tara:strand:+ start:186 stop:2189 length:2004 start_codon:yes stop_codon:yes gene_type:complete
MYRVNLYIDGQEADLFQNEGIEINLNVQNIKDISKVYGDFTNSFTIPASAANNKIFKHYYNVDIYGGFDAKLRVNAFIEVNNNLFRAGVVELESVQIKSGEPYAYGIGFYSNMTSLKDSFGEDTLNVLDLSAQDHAYNDVNIANGLNAYVSGTGDAVIYPLISPVNNWYYNSQNTGHELSNNISYHSGTGHNHGIFYYDLKPAVKLQKIIDAIEVKYGIEFQSDFFATADFGKLFMWCHRRAGYMFKDQPNGKIGEAINFTTNVTQDYNLTSQTYTITAIQETELRVNYTTTSANDYRIQVFVNGQLASSRAHSGGVTSIQNLGILNVGDVVQIRFAPPVDWDASAITLNTVSASVEYFYLGSWNQGDTVGRATAQSIISEVVIADQLPEQKISDFIGSLVRAFNLVIVPVGNGKYDIEPLDNWYAEGSTREVSEYVDTEEVNINKPSLYRRINFKYNETGAVLGEQYRLQNDIGYGDLNANFNFDGEELKVEVGFDNMLFERLSDVDGGSLTTIGVGKSITREIEPYIGNPFIFYAAGNISGTEQFSYVNMDGDHFPFTNFWLASNVNSRVAASVTKTLNFGTEVDPYLLQGFNQGLYNTYWKDYITDLYDTSRRVFMYNAQLPLGVMLALRLNDKLTIGERNYIINQVKLNLTTGAAQLELLNDV